MRFLLPLLPAVLFSAVFAAGDLPAGKDLTNSAGMKLVRVEPGEFTMGCGDTPPKTKADWEKRDWDESPAHKVKITKPYFMGTTETTNAQYEQFDPAHKKLRGQSGVSKADDEPVTMVTWQNAADFCVWLAKKEGKPYRLPTEAEWEYACRAGTITAFNTGDTLTADQANIGGDKKTLTTPVGSYKPNAWGLFDMHGNVAEWCLDWYGPYESGEQNDPVGRADGIARVARGGSYNHTRSSPRFFRSSNRMGFLPEDANRCCGFRVVIGEMPVTKPLCAPEPALFQRDVKQAAAPTSGPDMAKPFFTDFKGNRPTIPDNTWGPIFSAWNHDTAVCVCPNGDILATWYTTVSEEGFELAIAASRLPAGSDRWQPASPFMDVPDVNDHAPALLCDGKRLYHFSNQGLSGWLDAAVVMRTSDDSGATWGKPRIIIPRGRDPVNRASSNMPVGAFIARDGTFCLILDAGHNASCMAISKDRGETWQMTKGLISGIHAAAVGLDEGRILAFGRGPDPMPVSISADLGENWKTEPTPFPPCSVGTKPAARKLQSGALLLCGPDGGKRLGFGGTYAALSLDSGKTWTHVRQVPGVGGYLSVCQAPNGVIYLFGSRMTCAAFNEAWLREGKPVESRPAETAPEKR